MAIYTDGVLIQDCKGVYGDGAVMEYVLADGTTVYDEVCCTPGSATFTTPGTYYWTAPTGVTSISLCMIGGGGSGTGTENYANDYDGGGYAGAEYSNTVSVTPGATYTVVVGAGGAGVNPWNGSRVNGNPGTASKFGGYIANGGSGGVVSGGGYSGNGGTGPSGCGGGGYHDGLMAGLIAIAYGGQASSFGDGGDAYLAYNTEPGDFPGTGAGSGSGTFAVDGSEIGIAGGRGEVRISWNCA